MHSAVVVLCAQVVLLVSGNDRVLTDEELRERIRSSHGRIQSFRISYSVELPSTGSTRRSIMHRRVIVKRPMWMVYDSSKVLEGDSIPMNPLRQKVYLGDGRTYGLLPMNRIYVSEEASPTQGLPAGPARTLGALGWRDKMASGTSARFRQPHSVTRKRRRTDASRHG